MIRPLIAILLLALAASPIGATCRVLRQQDPAAAAEIARAGTDTKKLLELAVSFRGAGRAGAATKAYERVLELEPDNRAAHEGLGHQRYDGRWFSGFVELAAYKREQEAAMKAKGLARWQDQWVPEADVPFLKMRWVKDAGGQWRHPLDLAAAEEAAKLEAAGYRFRADDNSWVAPDDLDEWQAVQWRCGEQWLDTAAADAWHAEIGRRWELVGSHFTIWATCPWETANLARWHADAAYDDLVRCFGLEPRGRPHVFVLDGLSQYNHAAGNRGLLVESEAHSSVFGAYFADGYFDMEAKPPRHLACGVTYWDAADEKVGAWGPFWVRWAAAQSFVDAIDPSWHAVSHVIAVEGRENIESFRGPFWGEKKVPRWLRWGAATYVGYFMRDPQAGDGGDPWALRRWSCDELARTGGLSPLADVFALKLDFADVAGAARLRMAAGLLVAFVLDGAPEDDELRRLHDAFKAALKSGTPDAVTAAVGAMQNALVARRERIEAFAAAR